MCLQSLAAMRAFCARRVPVHCAESGGAEPLPLPSVPSADGAVGGASAAPLRMPLSMSSGGRSRQFGPRATRMIASMIRSWRDGCSLAWIWYTSTRAVGLWSSPRRSARRSSSLQHNVPAATSQSFVARSKNGAISVSILARSSFTAFNRAEPSSTKSSFLSITSSTSLLVQRCSFARARVEVPVIWASTILSSRSSSRSMQPSFPALQRLHDTTESPRNDSLFRRQRAGQPIIARGLHVMARSRRKR